ncbi:hypothetical protein E2C01_051358 [Portunus trituberculatus]|uniref:Uncharacterized protein n=1 Tax=Portunus trituberculatus TaxID=210409 RepID=A0A5B7GIP4_PORTR|nr:hypothetical protein [Portunus trituberculatus]
MSDQLEGMQGDTLTGIQKRFVLSPRIFSATKMISQVLRTVSPLDKKLVFVTAQSLPASGFRAGSGDGSGPRSAITNTPNSCIREEVKL